jgi:putative hydrolase of the HAD superfamily
MKPKLILFDLGRVLADLGSPSARMRLSISDGEFWDLWLALPSVQSFERGDICAEEFLPRLARELDIREDPSEFRQRFLDWHPRIYPSVEPLISSLTGAAKLALLSNTNILHWDLIRDQTSIFQQFDRLFLSFEIRFCKPEIGAFDIVLESVSVSARDILFLDDMEQNISSASRFDMRAVQVRGIAEVRAALADAGFEISDVHP